MPWSQLREGDGVKCGKCSANSLRECISGPLNQGVLFGYACPGEHWSSSWGGRRVAVVKQCLPRFKSLALSIYMILQKYCDNSRVSRNPSLSRSFHRRNGRREKGRQSLEWDKDIRLPSELAEELAGIERMYISEIWISFTIAAFQSSFIRACHEVTWSLYTAPTCPLVPKSRNRAHFWRSHCSAAKARPLCRVINVGLHLRCSSAASEVLKLRGHVSWNSRGHWRIRSNRRESHRYLFLYSWTFLSASDEWEGCQEGRERGSKEGAARKSWNYRRVASGKRRDRMKMLEWTIRFIIKIPII